MNNTTFLSSVELPTTQFLPTMAFPLMNAPGLTSVSSSIISGPVMVAVSYILTDLAIQISSPLFSKMLLSNVGPSFLIKSPILGSASQGYSISLNHSAAIVCSRSYILLILHESILYLLILPFLTFSLCFIITFFVSAGNYSALGFEK